MTMTSQSRRAGVAALVGTALEWYDFLIYGTAAALVLNKLFFPAESPLVSTLAAFATYAVGFLARPQEACSWARSATGWDARPSSSSPFSSWAPPPL